MLRGTAALTVLLVVVAIALAIVGELDWVPAIALAVVIVGVWEVGVYLAARRGGSADA
jgi:hypothetical protein